MVWSEARIIRQRKADELRQRSVVLQLALASANAFGGSGAKKAHKALRDFLDEIDGY